MLLPFCAQANLSYSKEEMLYEANRHEKEAFACLSRLENYCFYIPDTESKEHMKSLINSAVASTGVKGGKNKIITIGLGLIASLAEEMYERYCIMREDLIKVEYHFEMVILYNQLSLHAKCKGLKSQMSLGTKEFFAAIDNLTICELFTSCISDKWARQIVSKHIVSKRNELLDQFTNEGRKLTYKIYEDALCFYENISEITEEIEEEDIREEICMYAYGAVESIACVLREVKGFDCWPDLDEWSFPKWNYSKERFLLNHMWKLND